LSATILIGAGISASAFSHQFNGDVEIYEKASRVGGRLCARNYKEFIIQFGAQYATSSNSIFNDYLSKTGAINHTASIYNEEKNTYEDKNIWTHEKGMQFIADYGFLNRKISFNSEVIKINQKNNKIHFSDGTIVDYNKLILSIPHPQALNLLGELDYECSFEPCLAIGLCLEKESSFELNAIKPDNRAISWIASSRLFNKQIPESVLIHLSPESSKEMYDKNKETIINFAKENIHNFSSSNLNIIHADIFKWKYALTNKKMNQERYIKYSDSIYLIGDWIIGPRIENAFLSGYSLAMSLNR
jgi:renalase